MDGLMEGSTFLNQTIGDLQMKVNTTVAVEADPLFDTLPEGQIFSTSLGNVYVKGNGFSIKLGQLGKADGEFHQRTRENSYFTGKSVKLHQAELSIAS